MSNALARNLLPATLLLLAACGESETAAHAPEATLPDALATCASAVDHLKTCFPEQSVATPENCDADAAARVNASSCESLAAGKSDDPWTCFWAPWLCGGGTSATASGAGLRVAVDECGPDPTESCRYVTSAPCALVVVRRGDAEVARGYTNGGGAIAFPELPAGAYTVSVLARDGGVAEADFGTYAADLRPAEVEVEVGGAEVAWARFSLATGQGDDVQACVRYGATITVETADGALVDRHEVEWSWVVALDRGEDQVEYTRPIFIHHEATASGEDENVIGFFEMYPGTHLVRFIRVDVPSSARRPNPDYERLLRLYAVDDVDPIEHRIVIEADDVPVEQKGQLTLTDPVE